MSASRGQAVSRHHSVASPRASLRSGRDCRMPSKQARTLPDAGPGGAFFGASLVALMLGACSPAFAVDQRSPRLKSAFTDLHNCKIARHGEAADDLTRKCGGGLDTLFCFKSRTPGCRST